MTITLKPDELELFERAARALADRARREAENAKGASIEQMHRRSEVRFVRFADRLKAAQLTSEPKPPPTNTRPFRP